MGATGAGKTDGALPGAEAGNGAEGNAGAGGAPEPGNESGVEFNPNELHPALRGMKPTEITELFESMATTIREQAHRPASREPTPQTPATPPVRKQRTKDEWRKLLDPSSDDFDPEAVVTEIADRNYGKLLGDINTRAIRGMFSQFRTEFHDFHEFENQIGEAFKGADPTQITETQVLQAYLTAKGMKHLQTERQQAKSKTTTTKAPTPQAPEKKEPDLSEAEVSIARKMFRKAEDPIKAYREFAKYEEGMEVSVPLGGGKKG